MLKIALAGFSQGYYAVQYTRYLSRLKNISIIGICDLDMDEKYVKECAFITAEDFSQELQAPLYHNYEFLLAQKPDAVLICSETRDHGIMAKMAINLGIHVFVSKPLGFTLSQIQDLVRVKKDDFCLLCGNPLKYEQGIVELKERVQAKEIGNIYSVRIMLNHLAMTGQAWERDTLKSGGPFGTYAVYLFDLARWFTGKPIKKLAAFGDNYVTPQITAPDTVKILGIQTDGAQCSLELYSGIKHEYPFIQVEVVGDKGTLITKYDNYTIIEQTEEGIRLGSLRSTDMVTGEMDHFLDCILHTTTERCSLKDMIYVVQCIDAVYMSMEKHEIVELKWGEADC